MILDAKDISVKFRHGALAVSGLSFSVEKGEILTLLGDAESGKTTVLKTIAGLYKKTDGRILFNGIDDEKILPKDKKIFLMHEDGGFFEHRSVLFNLKYPLKIRNQAFSTERLIFTDKKLLKKTVKKLTPEERLCVMFDRATLRDDAEIFLLDDPFKIVPAEKRKDIFEKYLSFILSLKKRGAVVYATTDIAEATALGNVLLLHYGVEQQRGEAKDFAEDPSSLCALYYSQAEYKEGLTTIEDAEKPFVTVDEQKYFIDKEKLLNEIYIGKEVIFARTENKLFLFDKKCEQRIY